MSSISRRALPPALNQMLANATMLTAERERDLLKRYHATEDKAAMNELVRSHMPIIFRAASRGAQNGGVDINDLVQTATEGLLIAINRWSFDKSDAAGARFAGETTGAGDGETDDRSATAAAPPVAAAPRSSRLATYAMWWMRMLLTDSVIGGRGMVSRAKSLKTRKALFNMSAAIKHLDIGLPIGTTDVARIATYLGLENHDVEEALAHAAGDVMLDEPVGENGASRGEIVADERAESADDILARLQNEGRWNAVCAGLMALPPRDRFILVTRYLLSPKWKLDRLSETLKMSRERIRQIGDDGLAAIRRGLAAAPPGMKSVSDKAARAIDALVIGIEQAAANPATLAVFLASNRIAIGPTRIVARRAVPVEAIATPVAFPAMIPALPRPVHHATGA
jgi:RNA polymerase sigma-32 factor